MKKKTIVFYSDKEIRLIEECLKTGVSISECARKLSKKLGRSRMALMMKAYSLRKKSELGTKKVSKKELSKQTQLGLSDGTTLEFNPKKVILEESRIIIYI